MTIRGRRGSGRGTREATRRPGPPRYLLAAAAVLFAGVASAAEPCSTAHDPSGLLGALSDAGRKLTGMDAEAVTDAGRVITGLNTELAAACERIAARDRELELQRQRETLFERLLDGERKATGIYEQAWREALAAPKPAARPWAACVVGGGPGVDVLQPNRTALPVGVFCGLTILSVGR